MKPTKNSKWKYQTTNELEKIDIKTEWDLDKLFYKDASDEAIEAQVKKTESLCRTFAKKYTKADFTQNPSVLAKALKDYQKLQDDPSSKPLLYFWYRSTLNTHDHEAEKKLNLLSERLTKAGNLILFFSLKIGQIPKKEQKAFLAAPELAEYRYLLQSIFENAKHQLSEAEEKIMNLKSLPASSLWADGTEKILQRETVTFKKKSIPLNEALEKVAEVPVKDRTPLWHATRAVLKKNGLVAENELNALIINKKINDELRGFKTPYESKVLANENNVKSVEALVAAISDRGFALSSKFYELKAKLAGGKLDYANRFDPLPGANEPKISFAEAVEVCRDVFYSVKEEYGVFFDNMIKDGHVDVFPKAGRSGGAFMSNDTGTPIMVFLNHTSTFKALETLAHEMGHALHSHLSRGKQPSFYQHYSTTTAETASTLFENLVFDAVYKQADESTKATLLHDRLVRDISTIQRQIAFFNYEKRIHETVRTEGAITHEQLATYFAEELRAYLGKGMNIEEDDGYSFVMVGHFRSMFYVYTYAYGLLMSNLMSRHYKADNNYVEKIDKFLKSGGNNTVENIFSSIGIKASKIETFNDSLDTFAQSVNEFEKLIKKVC